MGEPELSDGCGCWPELCLSWQGGPLSRAQRCVLAGADAALGCLALLEPQSWGTKVTGQFAFNSARDAHVLITV